MKQKQLIDQYRQNNVADEHLRNKILQSKNRTKHLREYIERYIDVYMETYDANVKEGKIKVNSI